MANTPTGNSLSIFSVLEALKRRKLIVIIPTILLSVGFTLFAWLAPAKYRATATLAAEQTTAPEYIKHVAPQPLQMEDHLWMVREALFGQPVLEAAAKELTAYKNAQGNVPPEAIEELKSGIEIKVEGEHSFTLSYANGKDRYEAMNVTNKLAQLFIQQTSASRTQRTQETASVIDDQLEAVKKRLDAQSKEIHDYKQKSVTALPEHIDDSFRQIQSLTDNYSHNETKIAEDEARRTSIMKEMHELEAKGLLEQSVVEETTPEHTKLEELRGKQREFETRGYTPSHPEMKALLKQIQELGQVVASKPRKTKSEPTATYLEYVKLKAELEGIDQRLAGYQKEQQRINGQIATFNGLIHATPQNERVIEDHQREYDVGEKQLHALLDRQLDAKLAKGLEKADSGVAFAIVEPAGLPSGPYSPQRARLILMGIAAGLGMGLALAFVLEQSDMTFGTGDDFQAFTTLPVVGVIPSIPNKGGKKNRLKNPIVTLTDPESVAAEQYRILAMKLLQLCAGSDTQVVTLTSAAGGEGKSLTAINLAMALALTTDRKVLLVDADMRRPRISEYLSMTVPAGKGFHDLLLRPEDSTERYITKVGALHVIGGSVPPSNPVAALASLKARALFERLKQEFAYVIVDAPPTLPIADSHILSGLSDKVLFVVRSRETPRELFQHAVESFDAANLLGAVLNDVIYQRSRYAYAYEYYKKSAA